MNYGAIATHIHNDRVRISTKDINLLHGSGQDAKPRYARS
jgi:hypothetical protein